MANRRHRWLGIALALVVFGCIADGLLVPPILASRDLVLVELAEEVGGAFLGLLVATFALWRLRGRDLRNGVLLLLPVAVVAGFAYLQLPAAGDGVRRARDCFQLVEYSLLTTLYLARTSRSSAGRYPWGGAVAVVTGAADEAAQWWLPGAVGHVADLRLCLGGAVIAIALDAIRVLPEPRSESRTGGRAATFRAAAVAALALGGLIDRVHLGHPVPVEGVLAVVRSHYPPADLARLARDWRLAAAPRSWLPIVWHGEDRFAGEARWHLAQRARLLAAGESVAAYQTDRALAGLYGSFLAGGGLQRAEPLAADLTVQNAARAQPHDLGPFWLLAAIDRLTLWAAILALSSGLLLTGEWLSLGRG